jgi:nucleoid-associated protein YgaU
MSSGKVGSGKVAKLTLRPRSGGGSALVLPYNPSSLTVSAGASYKPIESAVGLPGLQFVGRSARTTSVEVRLDARAMSKSVESVVKQVFSWLKPTKASLALNAASPPRLALSWGKQWFDVVLTEASAEYLVFDAKGKPTRAKLNLQLTEVPLPEKKQNPTSGSLVGRRSHQVVAGDSLHSVANAEYGDPSYWRDLALVNRLDDPMSLRPGTRLMLPALAELPARRSVVSPWQ